MSERLPAATNDAVSLTQVAERAGVSIATASRVINGVAKKASGATTARVRAAVAELGYRPISVGRALRQGQSRLVALFAANLANPTMAAIAASVEAALRAEGLVMVLCDTHERPEIQDEYLLEMRAQLSRAIVLLGAVPSPRLQSLEAAGAPLLFVNRKSPHRPTSPHVGIDNVAAGREVASYFLRSRIAVAGAIRGALTSSASEDRIRGFRMALAESDQDLPENRVAYSPEGFDHASIGYGAIDRLIPHRPRTRCGVFCLSDLIAYGAYRRLLERGLRVPEDVLLFGFDDNPLNDYVAPWLNSVRVPYAEFGDAVVRALDVMAKGKRDGCALLPHRLVLRSGAGRREPNRRS